jgi:hypothetical protein
MSLRATRWLVGVGLVSILALSQPRPCGAVEPQFYDKDGKPLSFDSYDEVEAFLESAAIVWKEKMSSGTNKHKRKVMLQADGQSARAILRTSYEIKDTPGGGFVDSYMSELAAYRLALLLGLDNVPPVVRRKGGSLQIWIENATTDAARRKAGEEPRDPEGFAHQLMDMVVFDNLIANTDRNPGNIIIDAHDKVWFIDQTRSFAGQEELRYEDKIEGCSRQLWERLKGVSDEEIREAVGPYVKNYMDSLLERRRLLVDALAARIEAAGDDAFLFDPSAP